MKNVLLCLSVVAFTFMSCMGQNMGPTKKITQFEGKPITGIQIGSGFDVTIEQGAVAKAEFEVSSEVALDVTLGSNGTLQVSINNWNRHWRNPVLKLHLVCPTLEEIDGSGAASIKVLSPFSLLQCSIEASGASSISFLKPIDVLGMFQIDVSGASQVTAAGRVGTVELEASGASKVDCSGLVTEDVECQVSGVSKVWVYASSEVAGHASGVSNVEVLGGGAIRMSSSGDSSIKGL